jgi:hypothetical protein
VAAAADLVETRRGRVGPDARTSLSEARRHLAAAEVAAPTDPVAAVAEGERALALASSAQQQAERDLDRSSWSSGGGYGWGAGGGFGGTRRSHSAGSRSFIGGSSRSSGSHSFGGGRF